MGSLPFGGRCPSRFARRIDSALRVALPALFAVTATVTARAQGVDGHAWCGTDHESEAARAHLASYARARDAGLFDGARKSVADPVVGEIRSFYVLSGSDLNTATWQARDFELVESADHYLMWVDAALWSGMPEAGRNVVLALDGPMETAAPAGAFRSGYGVIENNLYLFGEWPELDDGDGKVDFVMYDIEEGASNENGFTAGLTVSADIDPQAPPGVGNQRLVLYLDGAQGVSSLGLLAGVAAHELTHLIHYRYDGDYTFNMEGLAEYSMLANGIFWRGTDYLSDPVEMALHLYSWQGSLEDYERASLFFGYLADRIGPEATGSVLRSTGLGFNAIKDVLATTPNAPSFLELVGDFHTANLVNDATLAPEFAHLPAHRAGVAAAVPSPIDGNATPRRTAGTGVPVEGGSVQYLAWRDVRDFAFRFYSSDPTKTAQFNPRMRARLLMTRTDGSREWHDLSPSETSTTIPGAFSSVVLILYNGSGAVNFLPITEYEATWQALPTDAETGEGLPTRAALTAAYPNPFNPTATLSFSLPAPGRVALGVFDVLGRRVLSLEDGFRAAGTHSVLLDASGLPAGTYLVALETAGQRLTRTVTYLP